MGWRWDVLANGPPIVAIWKEFTATIRNMDRVAIRIAVVVKADNSHCLSLGLVVDGGVLKLSVMISSNCLF